MRKTTGKMWYSLRSLKAEAKILWSSFRRSDALYHFIYGENDFRYAGLSKRINKNIKLISTYHQPPEVFTEVVRNKEHLKTLDAAIAVGTNQVSYLEDIVGKGKVHLVPHGIDIDFFRPSPDYPPQNDRKTCLFVGQWLRDFKCLREVIRLVAHKNRNIVFDVVTTKGHMKELMDLPEIKIRADISEVELLMSYQNADIAVLPLIDCTANNSVLEAMSSGLPIVTTDVGGMRDYVDESCALLVDKGDAESMAERIMMLAGDDDLKQQMGRAAREKAVREFDWNIMAKKLSEVYNIVAESESA
jgi:glycosyltransferase involved in cell wall biosynthesis